MGWQFLLQRTLAVLLKNEKGVLPLAQGAQGGVPWRICAAPPRYPQGGGAAMSNSAQVAVVRSTPPVQLMHRGCRTDEEPLILRWNEAAVAAAADAEGRRDLCRTPGAVYGERRLPTPAPHPHAGKSESSDRRSRCGASRIPWISPLTAALPSKCRGSTMSPAVLELYLPVTVCRRSRRGICCTALSTPAASWQRPPPEAERTPGLSFLPPASRETKRYSEVFVGYATTTPGSNVLFPFD